MTKTLTLTPVCGSIQKNVSATVTANGNTYNTNTSTVTISQPTMSISGNASFCSSTSTYSITGLPCNTTVSWSSSNTGIATIPPTGNPATLTKVGNGNVNITATINGVACLVNNVILKAVTVGLPTTNITAGTPDGSGSMQGIPFYYNGQYPYWDNINYSKYFEFESLDGHTIYGNPPSELSQIPPYNAKGALVIVDANSGTGGNSVYLRARAYNVCGASDWRYFTVPLNSHYYFYTISPNPAIDNITVQEKKINSSDPTSKRSQSGITEIKIFDNMGNLMQQSKYNTGTKRAQLQTPNLKTGVYLIEISSGQNKERQQVIIQK